MSIRFKISGLIELMLTAIIVLTLTSNLYRTYIDLYIKSKNIVQELNIVSTEEILEELILNSPISEEIIKNNIDYKIDLSNNTVNNIKIDISDYTNVDNTLNISNTTIKGNLVDILIESMNAYNKEIAKVDNSIKVENIDINKVKQEIEQSLTDDYNISKEDIDNVFGELNNYIINIEVTNNKTIDVSFDIK